MQSNEDIKLLVSYAHRGCLETIVEAQRRLTLLERFADQAILYPALHNFSPEFHKHELSAEAQKKRYLEAIAEAERIGLLCEQFNKASFKHDLEGIFDFLKTRHFDEKKKPGKA